LLRSVEIREPARNYVSVFELSWFGHRLEQAPPHDLESLFSACRAPRRLNAANYISQTIQRLASALASHFNIIGLRVRRTARVRRRKTDHQQAVLHELRRLCKHLSESELRFKAARRQTALVVKLPRVSHHSSMRIMHGPYSTNISRSASPGLVAFSSSGLIRAKAFLPPS